MGTGNTGNKRGDAGPPLVFLHENWGQGGGRPVLALQQALRLR